MTTLANLTLVAAFATLFFAAQALSTGPDDIEAARDMALATQDAIEDAQARDLHRLRAPTERMAWVRCKDIHGDYAQVIPISKTGEFICRRLVGVL